MIPSLRLPSVTAARHAEEMVCACHDLWIILPSGYVVEKYHEGRVVIVPFVRDGIG